MHPVVRTGIVTAVLGVALSGVGQHADIPRPVAPRPVVATVHAPPPAAPQATARIGTPTRVRIPAIGVDERLHRVGLLPGGAMQTPDFGEAGWYGRGPRPGAPGAAVLVAHVHGPGGEDVFAELHRLEAGDRVTVARTNGSSTFVVTDVEQAAKDSLPYDRIWSDDEGPVLRLITCGGKPDPVTRMYPDNTIVYAVPAG